MGTSLQKSHEIKTTVLDGRCLLGSRFGPVLFDVVPIGSLLIAASLFGPTLLVGRLFISVPGLTRVGNGNPPLSLQNGGHHRP